MHLAYILLGSNIEPEKNIRKALRLLRIVTFVTAVSSTWESKAVGSKGPNFLNAAICCQTELEIAPLKQGVLRPVEFELGRVRTQDKNAPRTIDLDIIVFDGCVIDSQLWRQVHVAMPLSELIPNLIDPASGCNLLEIATDLGNRTYIKRVGSIV